MTENKPDSKSEIITFDALFDLVRNEKTKEELIKTNPLIYKQIINYLKSKFELYKNFKSNESEAEKIKIQINNARKLIKEWYEKREKKITLLALTKSRIKNIDESSLLPEEKLMLDELTKILDKYRQGILLNLINLKKPLIENENLNYNSINTRQENNNEKENIDKKQTINENKSISENNKETPDLVKKNITNINQQNNNFSEDKTNTIENQKIKLRIFEDIPQFLGTNLEVYGPYKANEIIELPYELAEVILRRKKGEQVD